MRLQCPSRNLQAGVRLGRYCAHCVPSIRASAPGGAASGTKQRRRTPLLQPSALPIPHPLVAGLDQAASLGGVPCPPAAWRCARADDANRNVALAGSTGMEPGHRLIQPPAFARLSRSRHSSQALPAATSQLGPLKPRVNWRKPISR